MQYGGNQQRLFNMMMQARQGVHQAPLYSSYGLARPQPVAEPNFVTTLTENDVLLGRGTPCAENEGNVRFRRLVKSRKVEYIAAEKRMRKDAIAREILEVIAQRGGKFLRKVETSAELEQLGVPPGFQTKEVWAIVDEDTQVQKVKQALRNKDDAAELLANAKAEEASNKKKYGEHDVTNRFPRGVTDESDIHKADCNLKFGTGALERASSNSSNEGKVGSPKLKGKGLEKAHLTKSPGSAKSSKVLVGSRPLTRDAELMRREDLLHPLSSPANQRTLLSGRLDPMAGLGPPSQAPPGLTNMMRRQMWDKSQAAPSEGDLRTLQDLKRLRLMREQGLGPGPMMGLGPSGLEPAGPYGLSDQQLMMNAEYRQMQAQQAQMHQMAEMAAAREQAAMAASLQRSSFTSGMGGGPGLHPSAALAARQLQMESDPRRSFSAHDAPVSAMDAAAAASRPRSGADSAGERAIGIAQAMKRAEAFSPTESLEASHAETLILSVLCSHGLPVWTPEANTKSFVSLPTFAKRLDWTWYGFASVVKQKANTSLHNAKKHAVVGRVEDLTLDSAIEYQKDPRELATKTIMLVERLRRHCDTAGSARQRKQTGLGVRVPLWLDRELSRWAMTLDIADPTGRPVPFSSADFVAGHAEYKEDPAVTATAAFDPPLADDVLEQIALLTRLRSVFVKTKGRELHSKLELAARKSDAWEDQPSGWDAEPYGTRDLLLCDRLLSEGFSGVLTTTSELGTEYQMGASPRGFPSYDAVGLAKSSIQQRINQVTRELHALEEQKDLQSLRLDRMEKFAQSVLSAEPQEDGRGDRHFRSPSSPKKRKGSRSNSPVDPSGASTKKHKVTKQ